MKKIIISINIIFLLILGNGLFGQSNSTGNNNRNEYKELSYAIDSIISQLEKYSTFTEDDESISEQYVDQFKALFSKKALVYNDLIPDPPKNNSVLSVEDYVEEVRDIYVFGLGVNIKNVSKTFQKCKSGKPCEVKINFSKEIFGFRENGGSQRDTYNLTMTLEYKKTGRGFNDFKIKSIYNPKQEANAVNKSKNWDLKFQFIPSYSKVNLSPNESTDVTSDIGGWGLDYGISLSNYYYQKGNSHLGAGIGFRISNHQSTIQTNSIEQPDFGMTDIDGDSVKILANFTGVIEDLSFKMFDFSLYLLQYKYTGIRGGFEIFADVGINISVPFSIQSQISGDAIVHGHYEVEGEYDFTLDDVDYYNYGNSQISNGEDQNFATVTLSGFLTLGVNKYIGKNFAVGAGLNLVHGFSNISVREDYFMTRDENNTDNKYNSTISIMDAARVSSVGLFLGISYKF